MCTWANAGGLLMIASAANVLPVFGQGQEHADQHPSIICVFLEINHRIIIMEGKFPKDKPGRDGRCTYLGEHLTFTTDITVGQ